MRHLCNAWVSNGERESIKRLTGRFVSPFNSQLHIYKLPYARTRSVLVTAFRFSQVDGMAELVATGAYEEQSWLACACYVKPAILSALCLYLLYYVVNIVEVPSLIGHGEFYDFLKRRCGAVHRRYVPPLFLHNNHVQTVLRALLQTKPPVEYHRDYIEVENGKITLDWVFSDPAGNKNLPTVLILPGMTGSNDSSYSRHFVRIISGLGYNAVVFTSRGNGNSAVESTQLHHAAYTDDLERVVEHVRREAHYQPVSVIAVSMGGCITGNYIAKCHQKNKPSGITAALFISTGWNVVQSITKELERPLAKLIINRHLVMTAQRVIIKHFNVLHAHYPEFVKKALKARTLREFDDSITAPVFGFSDANDYYLQASLHNKIQHLDVPLLCLLAADDPIFPKHVIPFEELRKNENIVLLLTKRGGHIGHICQFFPTSQENYINIVVESFVRSVFGNLVEFSSCIKRPNTS